MSKAESNTELEERFFTFTNSESHEDLTGTIAPAGWHGGCSGRDGIGLKPGYRVWSHAQLVTNDQRQNSAMTYLTSVLHATLIAFVCAVGQGCGGSGEETQYKEWDDVSTESDEQIPDTNEDDVSTESDEQIPDTNELVLQTNHSNNVIRGGFDVSFRLDSLTKDPSCYVSPRLQPQEQYAFFNRTEVKKLQDRWYDININNNKKRCLPGTKNRTELMDCDLISIAELAAVSINSKVEPRADYNTTDARVWYSTATSLARYTQPLALDCAFSNSPTSSSCIKAREIFVDHLAEQTLMSADPFPDGQYQNTGHKALYVAGPVIAFSPMFDLLRMNNVFTPQELVKVNDWFVRQARIVLDGQSRWQRWLWLSDNKTEGSNHYSQQNLALAAIGGVTDNRCLVEYASYSTDNKTSFKLQIGRSLMVENDIKPHTEDLMGGQHMVYRGEAIDRYRGQWSTGHINQALGYSSLVVGTLGAHAILYANLRDEFKLTDTDLGADPLFYQAARSGNIGQTVSILDGISFYARLLERNSLIGKINNPNNPEDKAYWCSGELTHISPSVCESDTSGTPQQVKITRQHYTIFGSLIAIGAMRGQQPLSKVAQNLFFNCMNSSDTSLGNSAVHYAQARSLERLWPIHPVFWRPLALDSCTTIPVHAQR